MGAPGTYNFTVKGTWGSLEATDTADLILECVDCCESIAVEIDGPDPLPSCYSNSPSSLDFTIQFTSEGSPCSVQWKIQRGGVGGPFVDEGSGSLPTVNFTASIEGEEVWDTGIADSVSDQYRLLYWCGADAPTDPETWPAIDILNFSCA